MSIIVTFLGGITQYVIKDKLWFASVADRCPLCGQRTHRHGHYLRTVWGDDGSFSLRIFRRFCPACHKSFSFMPSFLKPYARFLNSYRLSRIQRHVLEYLSLQKAIRSSNPSMIPISVTTFRRWLKKLRSIASVVNQLLLQRLLELQPHLSPPSGPSNDLMLLLQWAMKFHDCFCALTGAPPDALGVFDVLNLEFQFTFQL